MGTATLSILSQNLKKQREKAGMSQDQLARKADIPYSTYLKIESGYTTNPCIQSLLNIATALSVTVDDLLKGKN